MTSFMMDSLRFSTPWALSRKYKWDALVGHARLSLMFPPFASQVLIFQFNNIKTLTNCQESRTRAVKVCANLNHHQWRESWVVASTLLPIVSSSLSSNPSWIKFDQEQMNKWCKMACLLLSFICDILHHLMPCTYSAFTSKRARIEDVSNIFAPHRISLVSAISYIKRFKDVEAR